MRLGSVFVRDGDRFLGTELALGPWVQGALHGGAPAALLGHVIAGAAPEGLRPARITYEFVRPVPVGPLAVRLEVVRPGRRVTLLDGFLTDPSGVEVARARALLLTPSVLTVDALEAPPFPGPEAGVVNDWRDKRPMFATEGMEIRFVEGVFRRPGPATAWFRLRHPLIAGEPIAPLERVLAAADFGNGIASTLSWEEHTFINPDLTVYVEREPIGEWVALQSEMRVREGSIALAESVLWDERGRIGRATQALLVARNA
jgi:Thioesterase-like superfamily